MSPKFNDGNYVLVLNKSAIRSYNYLTRSDSSRPLFNHGDILIFSVANVFDDNITHYSKMIKRTVNIYQYFEQNNNSKQSNDFHIPYKDAIITINDENIDYLKLSLLNDGFLIEKNFIDKINMGRTFFYKYKNHFYFLIGDNEINSTDSRILGLIPERHIIGKVIFVF